MLADLLLTQDLHCLLVCALSSSSFSTPPRPLSSSFASPLLLFVPVLPLLFSLSLSLHAADKEQQPVDADVLHLFPPHRQLLCAQHVCGRGGGELSQVSPAAGGGGGAAAGGEATETLGEEEEK